jgi:hypothetical protein
MPQRFGSASDTPVETPPLRFGDPKDTAISDAPTALTGVEKTRNFLMTGKTTGPGHFNPEDKGTFSFPTWLDYAAGAIGLAEMAPAIIKGGPEAVKIVRGLVGKFGSGLTKAPKKSQMELAFKLFKEAHGAAPKSSSEQVQALKEMREAMKTVKPEAAPKPAPKPPSNAQQTVSFSKTKLEPPKPEVPKSSNAQKTVSFPASSTRPETQTAAKATAAAKPSPAGTLTGPGEKPIKYESVKRTDTGAELRRDNFKAGIAKDHPTMTREDFMKLTAKQKNELIRKYNPQSINRPYIESSKVFEEFANHVWPN